MTGLHIGLVAVACIGLTGVAMPDDAGSPMPPNTVPLSQMMRELSARPGFTEAFLAQVQDGGHKAGAALLTPRLVDHLRDLIVGKNWDGLDRFPGWTMATINPTVAVVERAAGKATPTGYLDLGPYTLSDAGTVDLSHPSTLPGFTTEGLVSSLGDGVTRGDGPSDLAPEHPESQRLADLLNRLSLNQTTPQPNHEDGVPRFTVNAFGTLVASPADLIKALAATGHTVTVTDSRYFANFGHLHYNGQDVMMPFFVDSEIIVPGTRRHLLVPVAHAEYEWHIRGPQLQADVSFYFGIDGKAEFRTMDQLDQAWVMKRDAHTYTGADAIEVTRLSGAILQAYMRLHQAYPTLPFGGYYTLGVCQDVVAAIELKLTGKATLFPNTADDRYFVNPRDAEVNALIRRLPKDRGGRPPQVERIFASLPVGSSDDELARVTIPGLGADLIAVHDAWTEGDLRRTRPRWRRWALYGTGALLTIGILLWLKRRRA